MIFSRRILMRWRRLAASLVLPVVQFSCYAHITTVRVKDPSQVGISIEKPDGTSVPVLPPGPEPAQVSTDSGVTISREESGTIKLKCPSCPRPMATALGAWRNGGLFALPYPPRDILARAPVGKRVNTEVLHAVFPYELERQVHHYGGYRSATTVIQTRSLTFLVDTPWANIENIKDKGIPIRTMGWIGIVAAIPLALLGYIAVKKPVNPTLGWSFLGIGAGFGALGVGCLVAPSTDEVVYPPARQSP
jgi:hypothetical protein